MQRGQRIRGRRFVAAAVVVAMLGGVVGFVPGSAGAEPAEDPVVIVAGTFSPAFANEPLRWRLEADGYDAYIYELPGLGLGDIAETSAPLAGFVDQILADTGADRVDLIGHSQGGLVSRYYVKELGGAARVDSLISLGAPHYGTAIANIADVLGFGSCLGIVACEQMAMGSDFLADLNAGDDTIGSVEYTNLYTSYDELVRPVRNATLEDGATNVRVQSQCWFHFVEHLGLIFDGVVYSGIEDALEHRRIRLNCWAW